MMQWESEKRKYSVNSSVIVKGVLTFKKEGLEVWPQGECAQRNVSTISNWLRTILQDQMRIFNSGAVLKDSIPCQSQWFHENRYSDSINIWSTYNRIY